jgi:hypothetical protein
VSEADGSGSAAKSGDEKCSRCGSPVHLVIHESTGHLIALDPESPAGGSYRLIRNSNGQIVARNVYGTTAEAEGATSFLFEKHSCPNAERQFFSSWPWDDTR